MTAVEVVLLLIGVVFFMGSFFVTEKLSQSEIAEVARLSEDELKTVMNRELDIAKAKVSDMVDDAVDLSLNKITRSLEKETNEKIMAINEYSDTVMSDLKKSNDEVTFLYSMLADKHEELNETISEMTQCVGEYKFLMHEHEQIVEMSRKETAPSNDAIELENDRETEDACEDSTEEEKDAVAVGDNARDQILERYRNGEKMVDIAKQLGIGFGEVKLIVELYKGESEA